MSLNSYHKKRDFKKTTEPAGKVSHRKNKKRLYIIQKHAASHLHYDFRLELNGVLLSWAVPKGPCLDPSVKRLAVHVEDHPLEYGTFEGIIPKGQYGGGTVLLWDKGEWICDEENANDAYKKGHLSFILKGKKLKGRWKLIRIRHDDKTWLLMKAQDEYAEPLKRYDITVKEPNSVKSSESIEEIAENYQAVWGKKGLQKKTLRKNRPKKITFTLPTLSLTKSAFPKQITPELATLVDKPPNGQEWLHEIKFDGYRLVAFKKNGKTQLFTRNYNNWTNKFPNLVLAIDNLPIKTVVLDGEVTVLDKDQHANFQLLQNSIKQENEADFVYFLFDVIYFDNYDLTSLPLIERKQILKSLLPADDLTLRYSDHVQGQGQDVFAKSCEMGLEGIVSKLANSPYLQKRSKDWLKIKCVKRQEFVIGGFTKPKHSRKYFGSLLLGTYNKNHELIYNGNVGTGFTQDSLKSIYEALIKHKTTEMPFKTRPPASKDATWVKPILVAEVEFTEWTEEDYLRHPSFKGLRTDKPAKSITKENIIILESIPSQSKKSKSMKLPIKITNPDKILYPKDKITKLDIIEYYNTIHKWILPYIIERPLTLLRCPSDYQHCFYQKHINQENSEFLFDIAIKEKKGKEDYIYIKNKEGLLTLAQMGTLEIHPWGSTIQEVEYPDIITFDLDPAPDIEWKRVVAAAFEIKEHLAEFKLKSYVKTTGGKGLHVVVPIKPEYDWEEVKNFAHVFVNFLIQRDPKNYISKMSKAERKGKIFIDYLRNQRGATSIAPYSTRAREQAPVATPLDWDELTNHFKDTFYTIKTLPIRLVELKKDPWKGFFKSSQSLHLDKL